MNGNEIVLILRDKGPEKGGREVMLRLAEEIVDINRTIKEMASAFQALATVQTMLNDVADGLHAKMEKIESRGDDDPDSTRGMLE